MSKALPVRFASVGLGWVTTHRHLPALHRARDAQIVGVIDHVPGRAEAFAIKDSPLLAATATEAADVPWLDEIDAVSIGSPPSTHFSLVRSYLQAGKHVLVEKPMAMTVNEARDLAAVAARQDRVLAVFHNFQFTKSAQRLRRLITDGSLGEIRSLWAVQLSNPRRRLPVWYEELPLGLFYDESPHFFYLIRFLLGVEPVFRFIDVIRDVDGKNTPRKVTALLDAGKVLVQIDMGFQSPLSEWQIGVLGTERAAVMDVFRDLLVLAPNDGTHLGRDILRTSTATGWSHLIGTLRSGVKVVTGRLDYGNEEVVRRFCLACGGQSSALEGISASDGVAVVGMQHRIVQAAE